jgi:hypothetical protein
LASYDDYLSAIGAMALRQWIQGEFALDGTPKGVTIFASNERNHQIISSALALLETKIEEHIKICA